MGSLRNVLAIMLLTFILSAAFNLGSSSLLAVIPLIFSFVLLFFIVLVGVIFDILGVAAAAGRETPFHAMAAKKLPGAKQCIWLVRNADSVAAFSSDVVGDIAGTLSGAIGAVIVFRLLMQGVAIRETVMTTVMISCVAALTVGGKALGKSLAIHRSTEILFIAGRVLYSFDKLGLKLVGKGKTRQKRNRK